MKRLLLTTVFVGLVLLLAVAAVFALKGPASTQTAAPAADTAPDSALAPTATDNYNFIALPLDSSDSFSYTASGLAGYVPGTKQVSKWDASTQGYTSYTPGGPPPTDFNLEIGGAYFLLLDNNADNVVSFVGDVPAHGSVSFSLVKDTGSGCKYNTISIPLDQGSITKASELASSIGGVEQVSKGDAASQGVVSYSPGGPPPTDFDVYIGYPYFVCLNSSAPSNWP
jgi:hypothetical protein